MFFSMVQHHHYEYTIYTVLVVVSFFCLEGLRNGIELITRVKERLQLDSYVHTFCYFKRILHSQESLFQYIVTRVEGFQLTSLIWDLLL